ncbi:exported hypothetical protein [Sulfurovum sp. enrichment culture clone C5]|uniref:Uncharacterized protein n=1 Tax=Sulfurovum sp. enrichment culture clone C5 TaxID=497650 RepID=A0A0S4XLD4_9BACT|nr:exported hypothetical protein [Sulfurovum sp. enrichment culture clone C5]
MLEVFTFLGLIAFVAVIPLSILAIININKTNQLLKINHPELGRVSIFKISEIDGILEETRLYATKARSFFVYMSLAFIVMLLSGMFISIIM